jgi:adenine-specific DNA-methyltransferase
VRQQVLGEELEEEEEYYRFTWAGKSQARREAHKPSTGTLRPAKEESLDWDTTENMYIEGDNLEVLKLLQKSYAGKIKMIYIDPPYNTGKDFVYKDNYKDNLKNYQEVTGQIDSEGNKTSTNSDSDGRYHSNWLNMMYPRLLLARNLLKDDGVIFMSIDDNEVENLKKLGNEIFGEENFIGNVSVINNFKGRSDDKYIATAHEYLLIFKKNKFETRGVPLPEEYIKEYTLKDDLGKYRLLGLRKRGSNSKREDRPKMYYPIFINTDELTVSLNRDDKFTTEVYPKLSDGTDGCWRWGKDTCIKRLDEIQAKFISKRSEYDIYQKDYLIKEGKERRVAPKSFWLSSKFSSDSGTKSYKELMLDVSFNNPKSIDFIKHCYDQVIEDSDIVLDFFSGSASSAHSLLKMNADELKNNKFIMVQIPERINEKSKIFNSKYKTITEIGKERIRRVVKKIKEEHLEKSKDMDLGFKVFKLDSSNIKSWDGNPENLNESLFDAVGNIKTDRTEEDVLYEILLKYGLDLTLPIEEKTIEGKKVFNIGLGSLFICLADGITSKVAEGIGQWKEKCSPEICRVIFKDNGFTDVEKTNSVQTLKRYGINEIRSI